MDFLGLVSEIRPKNDKQDLKKWELDLKTGIRPKCEMRPMGRTE